MILIIELKIDPEFRDKIPAMPEEDFQGLRNDILRDGYVRDPLVVWLEEKILLDGHHRWRIIQENPELPFNVTYMSFPDRWACIAWICANQLHKHNMTELQRMKLIQEEHDARKNSEKFKGNQYVKSGGGEIHHNQNDNTKANKIRSEIAKEHGIGEGAVKTAVEVGRGIDKAAEVDPDFKNDVLSGNVKAKKSDLSALRKIDSEDEMKDAIAEIRNHEPVKKKNVGFNKEMREQKKLVEEVIADMYSPELKPFTIEMLEGDIEINGQNYIDMLRSTLIDRSTLLIGDNRPRVAAKIDYIISEIQKIRRLVE